MLILSTTPGRDASATPALRAARCLLAALAALIALSALAWTAMAWYRWHPHMPWRDLFVVWSDVLPFMDSGRLDPAFFEMLLRPHYASHRIALPRLLTMLDIARFHGQGHVLYASGWLGLATLLLLFVAAARRATSSVAEAMLCASVAGIALFGPAGVWNLVNPINTSWHLGLALSMAALLLALARTGGAAVVIAAYLLALLAALTNFAGVIALILLPLCVLRRGRVTLLVACAASAVLVGLLLQGVASDAAIATQWFQGDPAAASALRATAQRALDHNGLAEMAMKSLRFLGWPAAGDWPRASAVLVIAGLLGTGAGGLAWLDAQRRDRPGPDWWLSLYVLGGTLCIGVALATQLGRVIEQPNYIHGPSLERYQTVVGVYWACVTGLVFMQSRRLRPWPRLACGATCLATVVFLQAPWGGYLREEVGSAEYAARLFTLGPHRDWREPADGVPLRFKPEFVFSFDRQILQRGLAWAATSGTPPALTGLPACSALHMESAAPARGATLSIHARWDGWQAAFTRALVLRTGERDVGRMYPTHDGEYDPSSLLSAAATRWEGRVEAATNPGGAIVAFLAETPIGLLPLCDAAYPTETGDPG